MLSTKDRFIAWWGERPRLIPSLAHEYHQGTKLLTCRQESSVNMGQLKVWKSPRSGTMLVCVKTSSGDCPLLLNGKQFNTSCACPNAYGYSATMITLGQQEEAFSSILRALLLKSCILFSAMPFWWCALTPQKLIVYRFSLTSFMNKFLQNLPLSAW